MRSLPVTFLHAGAVSALALCPTATVAQSFSYSPAGAATDDANSENTVPFRYTSARYQQSHGDLTAAGMVSGLAMRRDGLLGPQPGATARTLDAALYCFHANPGRLTTLFGSNYATNPSSAVQRKLIQLPDFTTNLGTPAPWSIALPFDSPFSFSGSQPFGWELHVYSSTATGAYFVDSYESTRSYARVATTGVGCTATGRSVPMTLNPLTSSHRATNTLQLLGSLGEGPANAQSSFLIGTGPLDLQIPGLCTNLYVDGVFLALNAMASAAGTAFLPTVTVPFDPAFVGVKLYGQGVSVDAGQGGVPVALTNGAQVTIAAVPPLLSIYSLYAPSVGAVSGTTDPSSSYGISVRLTR